MLGEKLTDITGSRYLINKNEQEKILNDIKVGIWRIELAADQLPQLYGDTSLYASLGAEPRLNPEQLYAYWHERIEPAYLTYVDKAIERLVKTGQPAEVEYIWDHPQRGKTVVRCDATLASRQEAGKVTMLGLHRDITDKLVNSARPEDGHHIVDFYKMSLCGKYLIRAYEEIFLVNPETKVIQLIAYRQKLCSQIEDGKSILDVVDKCVVPEDQEKVRKLFSAEAIGKIIAKKGSASVDFKRGKSCGRDQWLRGTLRAVQINGVDELLFIVQDIQSEYTLKELKEESEDMLYSLIQEGAAVYKYDTESQRLQILKYGEESTGKGSVSSRLSLTGLAEQLCTHYVAAAECANVKAFLSCENINSCVKEKRKQSISLSLDTAYFQYDYVKISVLPSFKLQKRAYLVIELMEPKERMYPILEAYIRDMADHFYCIDLKTGYFFQIISGKDVYGVPPREGNNYQEEMIKHVDRFVPEEDRAFVKEQMSPAFILKALENKKEFSFTKSFLGEHGEIRRKLVAYKPLDRSKGRVLLQRVDITDRYDREQLLEKAKMESMTDPLTQLYNRLGSERLIKKAMLASDAVKHAVLVMLDLDNFKKINDQFGHPAGDWILREAALSLKECFRAGDIIGRLGGDEFIIFCSNIQDKKGIHLLLERVAKKLNIAYENETESVTVTASVGATFYEGQSFEELYKEADAALYHAKKIESKYALFEDVK